MCRLAFCCPIYHFVNFQAGAVKIEDANKSLGFIAYLSNRGNKEMKWDDIEMQRKDVSFKFFHLHMIIFVNVFVSSCFLTDCE